MHMSAMPADARVVGDATRGDYCSNLDILRLVAAIAIVWIHSVETPPFQAGSAWCRFAVPAFTATSVWLLIRRHGRDNPADLWAYSARRAVRIYLLFLVWNGIYAVVRSFKHSVSEGGDEIRWGYETLLLAGFGEQLWFLPFLCVGILLAASLRIYSNRVGLPTRYQSILFPVLGLALGLVPTPVRVNLEVHPATYWATLSWQAFPALLMAFAIGFPPRPLRAMQAQAWPSLFLVSAAIFSLWLSKTTGYTLPQAIAGVLLLGAAVLAPVLAQGNQPLRLLGGLALPVYLIHPIVAHAVQAVGHIVGSRTPSASFDLVVFSTALFASAAVAWFLTHVRYLRWLVSIR